LFVGDYKQLSQFLCIKTTTVIFVNHCWALLTTSALYAIWSAMSVVYDSNIW